MSHNLTPVESALSQKLLAVPYVDGGRDINSGLDCYGLILYWYKILLDIDLYDVENTDYEKGKNYFIENYWRQWEQCQNPTKHDVILFRTPPINHIDHAGIYLVNNRFLQCTRAGVTISRLSNFQWWKRVHGFYRYKK